MKTWDKIFAVQRMQEFIVEHYREELSLEQLARAAGYSPWHALRAFQGLVGQTPMAYLRSVRLSFAAKEIVTHNSSLLDIALNAGFGSHEGFTKAFTRQYGLSPSQYREKTPPIPLFSYYPISHYYKSLEKGAVTMPEAIVFTQIEERPARKLILKRGVAATEYFTYCEEVGCDVWGILDSVQGALYESIGLWLPSGLRLPGTSEYCQGVEVPADYNGPVPQGFDILDLPACHYLLFTGEPYEDAEFGEAIRILWNAIERYDPTRQRWQWAPQAAPRFQYAPMGERGYIEGRPVIQLEK